MSQTGIVLPQGPGFLITCSMDFLRPYALLIYIEPPPPNPPYPFDISLSLFNRHPRQSR